MWYSTDGILLPSSTLPSGVMRTRSSSVSPPLYIWLGVIQNVPSSSALALMFPPVAVSSPIENNSLTIWMICCRASLSLIIVSPSPPRQS